MEPSYSQLSLQFKIAAFERPATNARLRERAEAFNRLSTFFELRDIASVYGVEPYTEAIDNADLSKRINDAAWKLIRESPPVRLSFVEEVLEVTNPTVRAWVDHGVLEDFGGSPKRVGLDGVASVVEIMMKMSSSDKQNLTGDETYQREFQEIYGPGLAAMKSGDFVSAKPGPDFGPED